MAEKCRLCLENKKKMFSVFNAADNGIVYADMINSIANVKVRKDDEITKNICIPCCTKLTVAYDFKNMIQTSDLVLHENDKLRRIKFDNFHRVKAQIKMNCEVTTNNIDNQILNFINKNLNCGKKAFIYNGTEIKKLDHTNDFHKPMNIHDFLSTFKDESDHDDYSNHIDNCAADSDDEYTLPLKQRKTRKRKRNRQVIPKKRVPKLKKDHSKVYIKPVVLKDYRIVPTKPVKKAIVPKDKKKYIKKNICYYCGKITSSLKSHLLVHTGTRNHKCVVCAKQFFSLGGLNQHMKLHNLQGEFKCNLCPAKFYHKSNLESHMIVHRDEKKFTCETCNKSFKRKCALLRHVKIHNAAFKNIKCEQCEMTFITKYAMKHHLRVHTRERPCKCELCSQPYSYKRDFNRHCFKKHGIFVDRRPVYILNEEVLQKEREVMKKLLLNVHGFVTEDEAFEAFNTPQGYRSFQKVTKLLANQPIPVDLNC